MPLFKYTAKAAPGKIIRGEMQAENVKALTTSLGQKGLFPISVSQDSEKPPRIREFRSIFKKSKHSALVLFTRQMASLLDAGVTLHTALQLIQKQMQESSLAPVLNNLAASLSDGYKFSEACKAAPDVFSEFYINMIRAGETGGMLALVLDHLAEMLEKEDGLKKQIRAALAYPVFMFGMGFITITLLLTFVVPRIVSMFSEIGQTLPLPTRVLIAISGFFSANWIWLLVLLIVGIWALKSIKNQPAFEEKLHQILISLPFLGALLIEGEISRFARTLSALIRHGVPIQNAFKVVIAACKNSVLRNEFRDTATAIENGEKIGDSLRKSELIPPLLTQMIAIAEDTNQLEPVLERIANSSEKEVDRQVAIFTNLLEPAMIVVVGAIVGFIVFAMMMPIFQMDFVVQ